jgi:hypothetical protein
MASWENERAMKVLKNSKNQERSKITNSAGEAKLLQKLSTQEREKRKKQGLAVSSGWINHGGSA